MSYIIPSYSTWPITIPNASRTSDGVMPKELFAELVGLTSTDPVVIFADAVSGSDTNDGTLASPVATFDKAVELIALHPLAAAREIHLLGVGPYAHVGPLGFSGPSGDAAPVGIFGDAPTVLFSGTATANDPTGTLVTDAGLVLVPNALENGTWIEMNGQRRVIRDNTGASPAPGATIQPEFPFFGGVTIGDTFNVIRPETVLNIEGDFLESVVNLYDLTVGLTNSVEWTSVFCHTITVAWKLNGNSLSLIYSSVRAIGPGFDVSGSHFQGPGGVTSFAKGECSAFFVARDIFVDFEAHSHFVPFNYDAKGSTHFGANALIAQLDISALFFGNPFPGRVSGAPGDAYHVTANSNLVLTGIDIAGSAGQGIKLDSRSCAQLSGVTGLNTGVGASVAEASQIQFDPTTTITGAAGEVLIGVVLKTWATLAPLGFTENATIASGVATATAVGNEFTGLVGAALTNANVGDILVTSGFASANGTFKIASVTSATSCVVAGTIVAGEGPGTYTLFSATQPTLNRVSPFGV